MNCRPEIRDYLLAARMKRWLQIVRYPLLDTSVPKWKARRNYWALVKKYPLLARRLGYTPALAIESPLHEVAPAERQVSDTPPNPAQSPTEVVRPSCPPPTLAGTSVRPVMLQDEVL